MRRSSIDPSHRRAARRNEHLRPRTVRAALVALLALAALAGCGGPVAPDVAILGLEATTYVNGSLTFAVAVVGTPADSLELRRDGALFQVLTGSSFTWDSTTAPEGSYVFVARARRGDLVIDSEPKTVVVDRTPPTLDLTVDAPAAPIVLPAAAIVFTATADDAHGVPRVEFLDGDVVVGTAESAPYALTLPAARGLHAYGARAIDRAGNATQTAAVDVPVYVRETLTLASEAALDGCVEAGYEASLHVRRFDGASCTYVTSYPILHFFSFDRSPWPGALVEEAMLRFHLADAYGPAAYVASVAYADTADAPPTAFVWPFVAEVSEVTLPLATTGSGPSAERLDVTAFVQGDVTAERSRSQFRVRGLSGLGGGSAFYAEVADERVPELVLVALVP